jgi:hypothetical protein
MKQVSMADKLLNVSFAGIAVFVLNYVAYSLIVLAAYSRYVNGQILFAAMLEFIIVVIAVVFYSWRGYSSVLEEKGWGTHPNMKAWTIVRVGFVGSGFVMLGIFLLMIWSGLKNIFMIGSLGVAEAFLSGVWLEVSFMMRIIELRERRQGNLSTQN